MVKLTLVGGPTALVEYAGLRWLTDPALSPPGEYANGLVKTTGPAVDPETLLPIDVVLLSHDHHADNLDPAGREFLPNAGRVLTTVEGAGRLGNLGGSAAPDAGAFATGLEPWSSVEVERPDGGAVTVTAVPAQHGPDGPEDLNGPVIGFVLAADGDDAVYVSGDNASREVARTIAERIGHLDVAILFAGAVQRPNRFDSAYLTLSSDHAADAAKLLGVRAVLPVHFEGWTHFTQGARELRAAFAGNGIADKLVLAERGETVSA
jgi:L-ascorbate metabolism protein UlaG (beta-lactamase superfamily)